MARISFHDRSGATSRPALAGAAAAAALAELGIGCGRWALQAQPVSRTPQLTYARELRELQGRFDTVLTDRVRQPARHRRRPQRGDPRAHLSVAWPEPLEEHRHADTELRVLLEGGARYLVRAPAGAWVLLECEPGDWLALPAGMPHTFMASPTEGVEMLRLFARVGGWVADPTAAQLPQRLLRWPTPQDAQTLDLSTAGACGA